MGSNVHREKLTFGRCASFTPSPFFDVANVKDSDWFVSNGSLSVSHEVMYLVSYCFKPAWRFGIAPSDVNRPDGFMELAGWYVGFGSGCSTGALGLKEVESNKDMGIG